METRHAIICIHNEMNDGLSAAGVVDKFTLSNLYIHTSMEQIDIERKKRKSGELSGMNVALSRNQTRATLKAGTE